jgi:hypothetical protein
MGKYCSLKCQGRARHLESVDRFKNGEKVGAKTIKAYLIESRGNECSACGIKEWNGKPIVFDLEHINGNSEDNNEDNLCLLCPNCHSQTPTYKNRNKGNGRHSRRIRYAAGMSY